MMNSNIILTEKCNAAPAVLWRVVWGILVLCAISPRSALARPHWRLSIPPAARNLFFTDVRHGVLVGQHRIAWTRNGGRAWHWAKMETPLHIGLHGVSFSSAKVGWACGGTQGRLRRGVLLKTTDGGRVWRMVALPRVIGVMRAVWFESDGQHGRLLPFPGNQFFWQTADGGKTFTRVNLGHRIGVGWWIGSWQQMFLAGVSGHVIWRTTNAGQSWTSSATGLSGPATGISSISFAPGGKVGWAVGGQGTWLRSNGWMMPLKPAILHTIDGGKSWVAQKAPPGRTGNLTDVWAISPTQAWISSMLGYARTNPLTALPWLLHTTDGGKVWLNEQRHVLSVHKLFFVGARHGYAIGGQGGSPNEPRRGLLIYGSR